MRSDFTTAYVRLMATFGLLAAACTSGGGEGSGSTSDTPGTSSGTTGTPTTSGTGTGTGTGEPTGSGSDSVTGTTTTSGDPSSSGDTTQGVDVTSDTNTSTSTDSDTSTSTSGDTSTGTSGDTSTTGDTGCVKSENVEVTCDLLDNDCDGAIDNIDAGKDGICDCLNIGILGDSGFAPNANFVAWLEDQGTSVKRTLLVNNPGVVTPAFLDQYDLVLVDRIERQLSAEETAAIGAFVKKDGRGLITLIGYNFDNLNPVPEVDRANTTLSPFGLAYQGGYFGDGVIPTFDQNHPISKGIFDVNFAGGVMPVDNGKQGVSAIFATVLGKSAGLAHQTAMEGGRVIVWGDEWLTFDSDWQGYADVQKFWVNMVSWAKPQDFCGVPQ